MTPHEEACSQLQAGDKVKVLRKVPMHDGGWQNAWVSEMDDAIGKTFTITRINQHGVQLDGQRCGFPAHAVEKVADTDAALAKFIEWLSAYHLDDINKTITANPKEAYKMAAGEFTSLSNMIFKLQIHTYDKTLRQQLPGGDDVTGIGASYRLAAKHFYALYAAEPTFKAGDKVKILDDMLDDDIYSPFVIDWKLTDHSARERWAQDLYYSARRSWSGDDKAVLGASYLDKEPYDFNTIKRKTPMSIKIETITFVNGQDVNKMSDDQIFDTIAATEQEIARLNSTEHKPASLQKRIDGLVEGIEQLVALSDSRPAK